MGIRDWGATRPVVSALPDLDLAAGALPFALVVLWLEHALYVQPVSNRFRHSATCSLSVVQSTPRVILRGSSNAHAVSCLRAAPLSSRARSGQMCARDWSDLSRRLTSSTRHLTIGVPLFRCRPSP